MRSNTLLLLLATVVALVILEVGLRLSGIYLTHSEKNSEHGQYFSIRQNELLDSWFWVHQPNDTLSFKKPEFTFNRITNSIGLSDVEWGKNDSSYVILGIGDSFTEGTGVDADSTWLKILESNLNRKVDYSITTMNAGVGGSDPVFEFMLLQEKLLKYEPQLVILSVNSSDILEITLRGGFERFKPDGTTGRPAPQWEFLYQYSHVVRLFIHEAFGYNQDLIKKTEAKNNRERFIPIMKSVITKLDSLSFQNRFEYLIIIHPIAYDFQSNVYFDSEMNELIQLLNESETPYVDVREQLVRDGFNSLERVEPIYWPIDRHFNKRGYELYAKYVCSEVESEFLTLDYLTTKQKHPQLSQVGL